MRAWQINDFGMEHLTLVDHRPAELRRMEVRVRVRACSLNYRDLLLIRGEYDPRLTLPLVPLSDGAGEVIEVGEDVERLAVGDRVAGAFAPLWVDGAPSRDSLRQTRGGPIHGMLRQEVVDDESGFVHVPDYLSYEEAATLPCAAVTAWSALSGVRPGERVVTQGTGGVSIFALQLAKLMGAEVVITSSSEAKLERARELGADHTIDYVADPNWGTRVAELGGADRVIELGGASTLEQSLRAVRTGGQISLIGILGGPKAEVLLTKILMNAVRVQGIIVGSRASFEAMNRAIKSAELRPIIDRVFDFEDAPAAFAYLMRAAHFGKVVIRS
ncbi:MAG: NADPH:quinone reductase-like Zn-dependent oxidoreductase [Polyangiales bacterium]|jgi:NADPH:quinone reductase-like Zn-dependent oxidoreductase